MMKTSKSVLLDIHNDKMNLEVLNMKYEALLDEANNNGLIVKEKLLQSSDGRIKGNRIAIRKNIETSAEKTVSLQKNWGIIIQLLEI